MDILESFKKKYNFTLDKFQIDAINSLIEGNSVIVSAPTGSGKTLIAEFAVFDALDRNLNVIYTTPLKALSNQKYYDFCQEYGIGYVGLLTGDISINPNAPILVMTTEILRNILYQDIRRLDSVIYIILDECHYMNDKDRGTVWEEVIIHCPKHILFVALSATISNIQEIASWMSSIHNKTDVILHFERPVPIEYLYFKENKIINIFNNEKVNKKLFKNQSSNKNIKIENPVNIINKLREKNLLPAIFFVFSRKGCDNRLDFCMSNNIDLTTSEEKKIIKNYLEKLVKDNPFLFHTSKSSKTLLNSLVYGIATHHSGLVPIMKHAIEYLFQKNLIKVIFATETLSAGINMPARTTVITSLYKRIDFKYEILSVNSFTQMTGRAGRRGIDKIGYCLIVDDNTLPFSEVYRLITSGPDSIVSNFTISYNMIVNLIKNFNSDLIINILKKSFGQYLNNREIINIKLDLENQKDKISKKISHCEYSENNLIDEMPILEYTSIIDKIKYQKDKINILIKNLKKEKEKKVNDFIFTSKKGSLLAFKTKNENYPVLGCILEAYKSENKKKSFVIVLTNKGLCKINSDKILEIFDYYKDVEKNYYLINKVKDYDEEVFIRDNLNKKIFSKKEEKYFLSKIELNKNSYKDTLDKEVNILKNLEKQLIDHKCYNCSILDKHLEEYNKVRSINKKINNLKDKIEYYSNVYLLEYNKLLSVLLNLEYVIQNNKEYLLTLKGEILSYIRSENDIAIAELINNNIFDNIDPQEIACILSIFLYEPRKESRSPSKNLFSEKLKEKFLNIKKIINKINSLHDKENIDKKINIDYSICDIVLLWCNGTQWNNLFKRNEFDEGDIIRAFRRIIDMLHQLKNIPFISLQLIEKFNKAIELLDKDLVSISIEDTIIDSNFEIENKELA